MDLREATGDDCRAVWEIASAPAVRRFSFSTDPIPYEDHVHWYGRMLADPDRTLYVGIEGGQVVGYVRFDRENGGARVSIAVAPDRHGQGIGGRLLDAAVEVYPHRPLVAEVQHANAASMRLFSRWERTGDHPAEFMLSVE